MLGTRLVICATASLFLLLAACDKSSSPAAETRADSQSACERRTELCEETVDCSTANADYAELDSANQKTMDRVNTCVMAAETCSDAKECEVDDDGASGSATTKRPDAG